MKKIILATLLLPIFSVHASDLKLSEAPQTIINTINTEYPSATHIKVERESHFGEVSFYEVEFKIAGKEHEILFNAQGKYISHEEDITVSQLPTIVVKKLKQTFKNLHIEKAEKTKYANGKIEYEIDLNDNGKEWEVDISHTGDILKQKRD